MLNDINGFHVKPEHAFAALDGARGGPVAEGNVGGGTGHDLLTSSRADRAPPRAASSVGQGGYTVGVLVQCNYGRRRMRIAGVPVGAEIPMRDAAGRRRRCGAGSIIIVVATDAPLLPHQLKRLARRVALGLARTGATAATDSGDIFLAFSTANAVRSAKDVADYACSATTG